MKSLKGRTSKNVLSFVLLGLILTVLGMKWLLGPQFGDSPIVLVLVIPLALIGLWLTAIRLSEAAVDIAREIRQGMALVASFGAFEGWRVIAGLALIFALFNLPYAYYQLLRWLVCIVACYGGYIAKYNRRVIWIWAFVALAVLFNPIAPIQFNRDMWAPIDVASAIVLVISIWFVRG